MSVVFKSAWPYQKDALNLPVSDVDAAVPFYETVMGFKVISREREPHKRAVLARGDVKIGLAENGGDPTQDGCFFEISDAEAAFAELRANGLPEKDPNFEMSGKFKQFFVVAPDGLCYCLGERLTKPDQAT